MILKIPEILNFKSISTLLGVLAITSVFFYLIGPNGVDWYYYSSVKPAYERIYFQREIVAWLIIDIVNSIDQTGVLMGAIICTLLVVGTYRLSYELTGEAHVSLLITLLLVFSNFYLLMSVNGLRQGMSLGFLLLALKRFHQSSRLPLIYFALSILSHNSAAIFLPMFLVRKVSAWFFLLGTFAIGASGNFLIEFANKNSNPSVTQNKEIFLALSCVIVCLILFHKVIKKAKYAFTGRKWENALLAIYLLIVSSAFYSSSAVYERLVYTTVPLLVIYFSIVLSVYRPRLLLGVLLIIIVGLSSIYSLSHPSVRNNYHNL